jgi:hypothetical protein
MTIMLESFYVRNNGPYVKQNVTSVMFRLLAKYT